MTENDQEAVREEIERRKAVAETGFKCNIFVDNGVNMLTVSVMGVQTKGEDALAEIWARINRDGYFTFTDCTHGIFNAVAVTKEKIVLIAETINIKRPQIVPAKPGLILPGPGAGRTN